MNDNHMPPRITPDDGTIDVIVCDDVPTEIKFVPYFGADLIDGASSQIHGEERLD